MEIPTAAPQKKSNRKVIIIIASVVLLICICGGIASSLSKGSNKTAQLPAGATSDVISQPTQQVKAADTKAPTNTPLPTATTGPTNTPAPTNTPLPTFTPTPLPEPVQLKGTGDGVVDIDMSKVGGAGVAHIIGNKSSRFFAIKNYDAEGNSIDLLVNTTDPYDGFVPIDFSDSDHTTRFEVNATGGWSIEVMPVASAHKLEIPGKYTGKGDDIIILTGGSADTAVITGNKASRYFGVFSYSQTSGKDLKVNTTDPYDGTVILPSDTIIIEVKADGDWSIEVKTQ